MRNGSFSTLDKNHPLIFLSAAHFILILLLDHVIQPNLKTMPTHPYKILLVDDEPNIVLALQFLLEQKGYQIRTASNGEEALTQIQQERPNLVLLDVMMPRLNGFDTAKKVRQDLGYSQLPIIFLTAKGTPEDRSEGYASGCEAYITKPFDNDHLLITVEEMLMYSV